MTGCLNHLFWITVQRQGWITLFELVLLSTLVIFGTMLELSEFAFGLCEQLIDVGPICSLASFDWE